MNRCETGLDHVDIGAGVAQQQGLGVATPPRLRAVHTQTPMSSIGVLDRLIANAAGTAVR